VRFRIAPLTSAGLIVLAGVNTWLLIWVVGEIVAGDQPLGEKSEWSPQLPKSAVSAAVEKPIGSYPLTLAHPVFYRTREPFVPPPAPPPPPPPKAVNPAPVFTDPGLILGGVLTNHDSRKVFLFSKADPRGSWLSEGESFMGWRIQSVDVSSARLQKQDRTIELQLYPRN
jgi:hypothetical protein